MSTVYNNREPLVAALMMDDGNMWLIGGRLNDSSTEYLVPQFGFEWRLGFNLTEPLVNGCAVRLSWNSLLVINGAATGQNVSTVTKYFNDWSGHPGEQLPSLKTPRSHFACSVVKNETFTGVLVAGGFLKGIPRLQYFQIRKDKTGFGWL